MESFFETRLLNLRINFFIYCGLFVLILVVFCVVSSFLSKVVVNHLKKARGEIWPKRSERRNNTKNYQDEDKKSAIKKKKKLTLYRIWTQVTLSISHDNNHNTMNASLSLSLSLSLNIYIYICVCANVHICMRMCVHLCMCVCMCCKHIIYRKPLWKVSTHLIFKKCL